MKDSILRLTLDEDLNVTYETGANILNQHSVARQYLEVRTKNFTLSEDERLYVAFSYVSDSAPLETAYIYLPCVEGVYRTEVPYDVCSRRGAWKGNFAVKSDFEKVTDEDGTQVDLARRVKTSKEFDFTEYSALDDSGTQVPTITDIKNYYTNANAALQKTSEDVQTTEANKEAAQAAVTNITNIINTAKVGFRYDEANEELTLTVFTDTQA